MKEPRFYRDTTHWVAWEIYSWRSFFLTLSIGRFEVQINKWPNG